MGKAVFSPGEFNQFLSKENFKKQRLSPTAMTHTSQHHQPAVMTRTSTFQLGLLPGELQSICKLCWGPALRGDLQQALPSGVSS